MKFTYDPDVEEFRQEVRDFIAKELPPEEERQKRGYEGGFKTNKEEYDYTMGFQKKLTAKGWLAMAWPKEYGGSGASHMRQLVYNEEMAYAGAPVGNMGVAWVGPSLMLYGTEEQKKQFIPRITGADDWWCTLYSEPGSGSDLASLQTRAVKDGDDYIINGQKIWTSGGHLADWGWLAARTDPDAPLNCCSGRLGALRKNRGPENRKTALLFRNNCKASWSGEIKASGSNTTTPAILFPPA